MPESAPLLDPESAPLLDPESTPLLDPESTPLLDPESTPLLDPESTPLLDPESTPLLEPESFVEPVSAWPVSDPPESATPLLLPPSPVLPSLPPSLPVIDGLAEPPHPTHAEPAHSARLAARRLPRARIVMTSSVGSGQAASADAGTWPQCHFVDLAAAGPFLLCKE
jgi:hypothetical protein